jgi:hypothetical protein
MILINTVPYDITNNLTRILTNLKLINKGITSNTSCTVNGFQTDNLCYEPYIQNELNIILDYIPIKNLTHRWFHMIDYEKQGHQVEHDHAKTEDYSYILYLTDCNEGGETIFTDNNETLVVKPEINKIVFFESSLWHKGNATLDNKKVAVGALVVK